MTLAIPFFALALAAQSMGPAPAANGNAAPEDHAAAAPLKGPAVVESGVFKVDQQTAATFPRFALRNPRYLLRPGDVIDIAFPFTPEFGQTVTVQPDGFVSFRNGQEMKVSGLSVPQFREATRKAYAQVLRDPTINIELKQFEKPYFIANGQFNRPGKYDLTGDLTVTEAVALAGGFNESAKHSNVLLVRRASEDQVVATRIDVKKMLAMGDVREDIHLQPGDMLFVPQNFASKIKSFLNPHLALNPGLRY